jgi:phage terminase large subunit
MKQTPQAMVHPYSILVVGQDFPNLRKGPMTDFKEILKTTPLLQGHVLKHDKTNNIYYFKSGAELQFSALDDAQDAKSGKRDITFVNEANGIEYEVFEQIDVRTRLKTIIDYNPNAKFWVHTEVLDKDPKSILMISTFANNKFIPERMLRKILSWKKTKPNRWRVYGLGLTGITEDAIFPNVNWITNREFERQLPNLKKVGYGMDYGFNNDILNLAQAGVDDSYERHRIYARSVMQGNGIRRTQIAKNMRELGIESDLISMDNAVAQEIAELLIEEDGFNIKPANRSGGAIRKGLALLEDYDLYIVYNNRWMEEQEKYIWVKTKGGIYEKVPYHRYNDCFVGETMITTSTGQKRMDEVQIGDLVFTRGGFNKVLHVFNIGEKPVRNYRVQSATFCLEICCTEDHLIKTNEGWTEISKLKPGMTVSLIRSSTVKFLNCTLDESTSVEAQSSCTDTSGKSLLGKVSQRVGKFTTKMKILGTTLSTIWNCWKNPYIEVLIEKPISKTTQRSLKNFILKALRLLRNGINLMRVGYGTVRTVRSVGRLENIESSTVSIVGMNLKLKNPQTPSIVTTTVKQVLVGEEMSKQVYDLMVDQDHEYFANGLLVHNCWDSLRYWGLEVLAEPDLGDYDEEVVG